MQARPRAYRSTLNIEWRVFSPEGNEIEVAHTPNTSLLVFPSIRGRPADLALIDDALKWSTANGGQGRTGYIIRDITA
ncbi:MULTISPECIES: hypothetical protein [Acidiphilium]|uniref:Uncharacterized protein n=1 Tax=Acidiphilium rubrum TaxID=526 RepID=A0A8G2FLG3_ACIRU|nr:MULTISPECIES: hypothetical protein [Acidiphilium]SIQ89887.1 hypothetical protein SAMN05421828_11164 [Acidiphilium rubrum]